MKKFDAIILGFGKGGKTLAGALARAGKQVAVVERSEKMFGGTCINAGCIPTKFLVRHAELSHMMGGGFRQKEQRYQETIQKKRELVETLRQKNYHKLADQEAITVLLGTGSFLDPHHILVEKDGNREELEGETIFINTGARPNIPPIPGLKESRRAYLSETMLDLENLPRRLVIIGGGYIGMEFASIYTNFGSQVTVVQDGPDFLPREDREIAGAVRNRLEKEGVRLLASVQVRAVKDLEEETVLSVQTPEGSLTLPADAVLVAAGRRPNTSGLNLAEAGIETTARGGVKVDSTLRTTAENVWAMGDVTGGLQFTYISLDDFRIVQSQILGDGGRTTENRGAVPYSVFLDPPFSRVGLSEQDARAKGYAVKIARLSAAAIPKAKVLGQSEGLLKAVIDAQTGQILGAHLFCAQSHEVINLIKLAMDAKLPYTVLRDSIYTHPTMSEALNDLFASLEQ